MKRQQVFDRSTHIIDLIHFDLLTPPLTNIKTSR